MKDPKKFVLHAVLEGPAIEEAIFRLLPSIALDLTVGKRRAMWEIGIPVSVIFAGSHNISEEGLDLKFIPLPHFVGGGLFYWYLQRKRGFDHALAAHMFQNAIGTAMISKSLKKEGRK